MRPNHMQANTTEIPENAIAVIGMDCRFPKANSTEPDSYTHLTLPTILLV